jgi:hypothetical protein
LKACINLVPACFWWPQAKQQLLEHVVDLMLLGFFVLQARAEVQEWLATQGRNFVARNNLNLLSILLTQGSEDYFAGLLQNEAAMLQLADFALKEDLEMHQEGCPAPYFQLFPEGLEEEDCKAELT